MGNKVIKKSVKSININDYSDISVPKEYQLLKLVSYNLNISNTINSDVLIKKIVSFVAEIYKGKANDIICLQGINDHDVYYKLMKRINNFSKEMNDTFYIAPENNCIEYTDSGGEDQLNFNSAIRNRSRSVKDPKHNFQNIIISRYPIVSTMLIELDDNHDVDDVLGIKTLVGCNISIYGNLISIFNTELSKDIKIAGIINDNIRQLELNTIFDAIENNRKALASNTFREYTKTDINFLVGSLNICEFIGKGMNTEFIDLIKQYHCVDIYRHQSNEKGYTTQSKKRLDYIMFLMTSDIYKEESPFNKKLQNINDSDDLIKFLTKRYKLYFININIIKNEELKSISQNYPIELVFILYKNKH